MNAELQNRQNEIVEEFAFFEDWMEKYEHVIELGKELEALPEEEKQEDQLIRGCQSRVWLTASKGANGEVWFRADSDAIITKGFGGVDGTCIGWTTACRHCVCGFVVYR